MLQDVNVTSLGSEPTLKKERNGKKRDKEESSPLSSTPSNIMPILAALLPSVLSSLTGIGWTEYLVLALVLFYLFMALKGMCFTHNFFDPF
jgi:hypothetical protein